MKLRHVILWSLVSLVPLFVFAACSKGPTHPFDAAVKARLVDHPGATDASTDDSVVVSPVLDAMNQRLASLGINAYVPMALLVASGASKAQGITLLANDRDRQPLGMWVPGDTRRNALGNSITYLVDQSDCTPNGGLTEAQTEAAIDRAMATWNAVSCANLPIVKVADPGVDPDVADGIIGNGQFGSVGTPHYGDIVHAGWMPPAFFDALFPGGGTSFLAVTFPFVYVPFTDINGDKKIDLSFAEIYYNNYFQWGINADPPIADVQSVALHEAGHGLAHGHFGKIFIQNNGDVQFAPYAVMNAIIFGQHQTLEGSDNGGHCLIWGSWPNH